MFRSWLTTRKWFRYLVASECYSLTHEFVTSKLLTEFNEGGWHTGIRRSTLLDLDKDMKEFAERIKDANA